MSDADIAVTRFQRFVHTIPIRRIIFRAMPKFPRTRVTYPRPIYRQNIITRRVSRCPPPPRRRVSRRSTTRPETVESPPPNYWHVPNVHPPHYEDDAVVPSYCDHHRDEHIPYPTDEEFHIQGGNDIVARVPELQHLRIPPSDTTSVNSIWDSQHELDDHWRWNLNLFKDILTYLREDPSMTLNSDVEGTVESAHIAYDSLKRSIQHWFDGVSHDLCRQVEERLAAFNSESHNPLSRALEIGLLRRRRNQIKDRTRRASASRIEKLDEAMGKIDDERRQIYIRTMGLQQC